MSGVVKSETMQSYDAELRAYELRFAAWLGIDPEQVMHLVETKIPERDDGPLTMPPGLKVTWESIDARHDATEEHDGQHPLPIALRGAYGEPTVVMNRVHLDWRAVENLRREVGERPAFPTPAGGWPAHWPKS